MPIAATTVLFIAVLSRDSAPYRLELALGANGGAVLVFEQPNNQWLEGPLVRASV